MKTHLLQFIHRFTLLVAIGLLVSVYSGVASNATWKAFTPINTVSHVIMQHGGAADSSPDDSVPQIEIHHHAVSSDGLWYAPSTRQRCLSMSVLAQIIDPPSYSLAAVLPLPLVPLFSYGYAVALPSNAWILSYQSHRLRLNGWQDANLQYRFSQQA
ncbi:hypothetical protein L9G15_06675 [Shewanella sp. A3A]|nr:hypothetical protein [Shewanella ferrihydritica]